MPARKARGIFQIVNRRSSIVDFDKPAFAELLEVPYNYYAFISYSRKDADFAKELQRYLTRFRLPSKLCKKFPDTRKNVRDIFRDSTDLPIGNLKQVIKESLAESKYLIVICSENAAKGNDEGKCWVDQEVGDFIALNPEVNKKRIVPIIYRKEGGARATACIPSSIKGLDLGAPDVMNDGKELAFCKVVATMLGLQPKELYNEYEKELENKRENWRIAIMIAITAAIVGGYRAWDYYYPHISYYADYKEVYNIPVGINELTEKQIATRSSHYRFTVQKHNVVRVDHCDSTGSRISHDEEWNCERPTTIKLEYTSDGEVSKRTHLDSGGSWITCRFENDNLIEFKPDDSSGLFSASSFMYIGSSRIDKYERAGRSEITRFITPGLIYWTFRHGRQHKPHCPFQRTFSPLPVVFGVCAYVA